MSILFAGITTAAWILGASAVGSNVAATRKLALAGVLLIVPFAIMSLLWVRQMKRWTRRVFVLLLLVAAATPIAGQPASDEEDIRTLVTEFETAWNTHDMNRLGRIVTDDVDFVNVAGLHWKGREEVVREHAARHRVRFKDSVWTTERVLVQFLRPDVALVHVDWGTRGDLDFDLKPWPPRKGTFLWVVVRNNGVWRIRAVQNTDKG